MKQIIELQEARQIVKSTKIINNEERYYEIYLSSNVYIRVTYNQLMSVLFLLIALFCALQGLNLNENEKDSIDGGKNQKTDKLSKALTLSGFSKKSHKGKK